MCEGYNTPTRQARQARALRHNNCVGIENGPSSSPAPHLLRARLLGIGAVTVGRLGSVALLLFLLPLALVAVGRASGALSIRRLRAILRRLLRCWREGRCRTRGVCDSGGGGSLRGAEREALLEAAENFKLALDAFAGNPLLLPHPTHLLELRLQVAHRLVHEQLLERPLLDVPRFILFQMVDVLYGARENRALRFLSGAIRDDATKLIDPFVDVSPSTALDFFLYG